MDLKLKNKTVLITGASKGIGFTAALTFAAEGARVAINARGVDDLRLAANQIRTTTGAEILEFPADVTNRDSLTTMVDAVIEKWGCIDILINNAGMGLYRGFLEATEDDLLQIFQFNYFSAFRLSQLVVPHMIKNGGGSIVNVGGITGAQAVSRPNFSTVSGPTKAAMLNFTKALATEVGPKNIRVNIVMPGLTVTPRFQEKIKTATGGDAEKGNAEMQRWGQDIVLPNHAWATPEQVADVIVFVASERASYLTAASVNVDGGMVKAM